MRMIVHDEIASTDFNSDNRSDFLLLSDKKRMIFKTPKWRIKWRIITTF